MVKSTIECMLEVTLSSLSNLSAPFIHCVISKDTLIELTKLLHNLSKKLQKGAPIIYHCHNEHSMFNVNTVPG